jgi:high-affinity iron transporter
MWQALVITLREGLEAFLIVAISLAYLRKSGRRELTQAVHWGIGASLALSAIGGYLLYNAANQEWLDGPLAIAAAASVTWMVVHMWRAGRRMKGDIEGRLQESTGRVGTGAFLGVFLFTVLMITREGMETALLLLQIKSALSLVTGALLGVVGAAGVAWLWSHFGHRVNLTLFFQMTAIFLLVFVIQLSIYGIHEMSEQNFLPFSTAIHEGTEAWGPDSPFGHILTYSLVMLPLGWLALKSLAKRGVPKDAFPQGTAAR